MRRELNELCSDKIFMSSKKDSYLVTFIYNKKKKTYEVSASIFVVCTNNLYAKEMYTSQKFSIKSISEERMVLNNGKDLNINTFYKYFILAFAIIVYKYQGNKIDEPYNM
jgi:hypothetical protein